MTTRALVTGANGFVAQWAIRAMLERGWTVTAGTHGPPAAGRVLSDDHHGAVTWRAMDVTRQDDLATALDAARPDLVLHLAAISHVPDAARNPALAFEVNAVATVRLLGEVQRLRAAGTADPRVLVIGSAEQYGRHDAADMPLGEDAEQRPLTLYAASKVAQEVAALQAARSDGVRVVCTRSFSHSGVGHGANFLLPALVARALALPATGGRLAIGNAGTVRDLLHVEDVVAAYLALHEGGAVGEAYNVCSGEGVSVRDLALEVLARTGKRADIVSEASYARPVDVPVQVGDNSRLRAATGWAPRFDRGNIIDDLIHAATH